MIQSMKWRVLIWVAVGAGVVAAAGLAVDVAVAGMDRASGLAGVLVGFCELGALVLGVAAWAAERRAVGGQEGPTAPAGGTGGTGEAGEAGGSGERPAVRGEDRGPEGGRYVVNADKIDRAQFGDGNTQHNG